MSEMVTRERVIEALSHVQDPELGRDLVTLGMVRGVTIDGGRVAVTIVLTTPACPLRETIESNARAAVGRIPGVSDVSIAFDAEVARDRRLAGRIQVGVKNAIAVGSGKGGVEGIYSSEADSAETPACGSFMRNQGKARGFCL